MRAPLHLDAVPAALLPAGHSLQVARFDLQDEALSGNKRYKLLPSLEQARAAGASCIASFGGAWSNHLHALAAAGARWGIPTVGFVRGELGPALTPTLEDARRWGMCLQGLSRSDYRRRAEPGFTDALLPGEPAPFWVPEGGASEAGVAGCEAMGRMLLEHFGADEPVCVVVACGTGATFAGLLRVLPARWRSVGVPVLKGARDLDGKVRAWAPAAAAGWSLRHEFHRGGYARCDDRLLRFCADFAAASGVPLEPVYTGKMMMAVLEMMAAGEFESHPRVVAIHSGGMQGARGFPELVQALERGAG